MSKKQVVLLSFVVAIPAICLLVMIVLNGMDHGSHMFSGLMTAVVVITGLLVLILGLSPFVLMGLYPAEGFSAAAAAPGQQSDTQPPPPGAIDEEYEEDFEEEEPLEDDAFDEDDTGEELFDEGFDDDFDDDFEDEEWD